MRASDCTSNGLSCKSLQMLPRKSLQCLLAHRKKNLTWAGEGGRGSLRRWCGSRGLKDEEELARWSGAVGGRVFWRGDGPGEGSVVEGAW